MINARNGPFIVIYVMTLIALAFVGVFVGGHLMQRKPTQHVVAKQPPPPPPSLVFYDMPRMEISMIDGGGRPHMVYIALNLEVSPRDFSGMKSIAPRIVDRIVGWLRKQDVAQIRQTKATRQLREDLLGEVNLAAAPVQIADVAIREFVVE